MSLLPIYHIRYLLIGLLTISCIEIHIEELSEIQHLSSGDGFLLRRCGSLTSFRSENGTPVCKLNVFDTMPKKVKSKSVQKAKKSRQTLSGSSYKRTSIPRNCKNITTKKKTSVEFNFLSIPSRTIMGASQVKISEIEKDKKEQEEEAGWSSEDLDVVYDLQEEKKNKIYEVITVMSDDETPNKITYERIYADDPEKKVLEKPEAANSNIGSCVVNRDIVSQVSVIKEIDIFKDKTVDESEKGVINKQKLTENSANVNMDTKSDSDSEVICIGVVDAKTKAEQKKDNIEEICLSSDSEPEFEHTVPPIRLKVPVAGYPYINKFLHNDGSENSYESNNSNFSFGYRRTHLFPYSYGHKQPNKSNSVSDWESCSTSPKALSSDDFSPAPTDSPKMLSGDESSSSVLSDLGQPQPNLSPDSDNENSSTSSTDEDKESYWKAKREAKRKEQLRYEEFTELGKRIQEGQVVVTGSSLTFKVMSYNVLSQHLLEEHRYLYKQNDRKALVWPRRWSLLYNEIKDENPEILCLQEVEQAYLVSDYAKLLDLGYRWVYKKRTNANHDGVAVFYKAAVFEEEAHAMVEFYQPGVSVLDRDNVGVVLRLRLKQFPQQAIVVATTHLLYNPRRGDVKLAQMQVLLAEIDRLAFNKDALTYYPIIMTGDFNLKPGHGVYKLLTEGKLLYEGMSRRNLRPTQDQNVLPKTLIPCRLGITDRCQHVDVLEARVRGEDAGNTKLYHSEINRDPHQEINYNEDCSKDDRFESGTLYQGFNFESVYSHKHSDGQKEASTHHESWITVDYIFYSTAKVKEGQKKEEGSLQLLSRLRLPSQDECERFLQHLPNFAFGSDHLPLVGKFLLRLH